MYAECIALSSKVYQTQLLHHVPLKECIKHSKFLTFDIISPESVISLIISGRNAEQFQLARQLFRYKKNIVLKL